MPEYDAFGRKVGDEDGAASTPTPVTPASSPKTMPGVPEHDSVPTPTPAPSSPAQPKLKLSGVPSRTIGGGSFSGGWVAVVIMVAVIAGGAIIAFTASNSVDHAIR